MRHIRQLPFLGSKVWAESRDSTTRPGRPGIDKEAARQFGSNLDSNLDHIARQLGNGTYGFSKLRVVFVPKPDSDKERVICIPTVRDRLVQRAIGEYITSRSLFPIYNNSSFGFIRGLGPHDAIERTLKLREAYPWCLKNGYSVFLRQDWPTSTKSAGQEISTRDKSGSARVKDCRL